MEGERYNRKELTKHLVDLMEGSKPSDFKLFEVDALLPNFFTPQRLVLILYRDHMLVTDPIYINKHNFKSKALVKLLKKADQRR